MQFILDHPEQWDQTFWSNSCGTAYCFAGHASLLASGKQLRGRDLVDTELYGPDEWTDLVTVPDDIAAAIDERSPFRCFAETVDGGKAYEMCDVAEVALGMKRINVGDLDLFDAENSLGDLLWCLREWAQADGVELPQSWPTDLPRRNVRVWGSSVDEY
ncbi:hypothetical protein ACFYU5_18915 [Nocardia aobensis]|uniref:Uncharacterized protein n=1 Tax=Nocardia aobensis TaxID=257277 RepID=A0ABW6P5Q8_9NOCA